MKISLIGRNRRKEEKVLSSSDKEKGEAKGLGVLIHREKKGGKKSSCAYAPKEKGKRKLYGKKRKTIIGQTIISIVEERERCLLRGEKGGKGGKPRVQKKEDRVVFRCVAEEREKTSLSNLSHRLRRAGGGREKRGILAFGEKK